MQREYERGTMKSAINGANKFTELLKKKEPLLPELERYVTDDSIIGKMLRHPLVYSVPHADTFNALCNNRFLEMREMIRQELEKEKPNLAMIIFVCYAKPYRITAFSELSHLMRPAEYWGILGDVWVESENIWQNKNLWHTLLHAKIPRRTEFMSQRERKILKELPDELTVYRGYIPKKNKLGFSYTLNKDTAKWFANRFKQNGAVSTRTVKKSDVFAFKNQGTEEEIIILS